MYAEKRLISDATSRPRPAPVDSVKGHAEELLEIYLTLPVKERRQRFSDTAYAAELTGLTQRTIQLWIEFGVVQAVQIGRKYQVDLHSLKAYLRSRVEEQA